MPRSPIFLIFAEKHKNMTPFILRQWQESDVPALAKYLNNKKIWDNCQDRLPYPYTYEDAVSFIQYAKSQDVQNNYCIEVNAEAVGNISFDRGTDVERFNAEIGYWIAEPYWNKGIMTQALDASFVSSCQRLFQQNRCRADFCQCLCRQLCLYAGIGKGRFPENRHSA